MSDETQNSKARRDYEIETLKRASLRGMEVKSLRPEGQLRESFARVEPDGQAWLHNFISTNIHMETCTITGPWCRENIVAPQGD